MHFWRVRSGLGKLTVPALLLFLFPSASHAEAGELGGLAIAAFKISIVVWVAATLLIYRLCRRLSMRKRLGCTVLFFFLPILILGADFLKEYAFGEGASERTEVTRKPLAVYGVTFPPGSRANYDETGGFFGWGATRTLQAIYSPHPVLLGSIPIDSFIFIPDNCCGRVRAEVSKGVTINGWPCGDTTLDLTPAGPALRACFLAAPYTWRGQLLSAGVYVDISSVVDGKLLQ